MCLRNWPLATWHSTVAARVVRTRSNEQVRQPIYRSAVARWRNYEAHIGALLAAFPAGENA